MKMILSYGVIKSNTENALQKEKEVVWTKVLEAALSNANKVLTHLNVSFSQTDKVGVLSRPFHDK